MSSSQTEKVNTTATTDMSSQTEKANTTTTTDTSSQTEMQSQIKNLKSIDFFAEAGEVDVKPANIIHIRIQQTRGPTKITKEGKYRPHVITTLEGLPERLDKKRIVQFLQKRLGCAGTIVSDVHWGEVIQLQGDEREKVAEFLIADDGCQLSKDLIMVHD
ncbi:hypothetical protein SBOR_2213 [Sclerotinia borealis F-4128]|uniref:SUI1 domain-containing protein n=1 Tax=Sclerotinia borealis (strain F-4128) TaxID=1432307 RepID=W9CSD2_SCLBF|nr:hypothetical protein SBOR_2213 [Sclerotinia borealis F-4128]